MPGFPPQKGILDIQLKEFKNAGSEKIYREKLSGIHLNNRPELNRMIDQIRHLHDHILFGN